MKNWPQLQPRVPVATYRLQFNSQFRFSDAKKIVSYLYDLGISDIYASPYLKAVPGSIHGYDIVDHSVLNPEIGTEQEYDEFMDELHKYGMGQILDIVPNHMCVASKDNKWWMDVLENGPSSVYADYFDIDWDPVKKELKSRVLLPVLGEQYGKVLENQELTLRFDNGAFFVDYYEHSFPVRPQTFIIILEHRIEELRALLPDEDPHLIEFLSILTALEHLPDYTENNDEKITERKREKEVIKRRMSMLCNESAEIRTFIDTNVKIFNGRKADPRSFDLFDRLLGEQVYRLSFWRVATEEINYRRFFDINGLGAIRVENTAVFKETHELIMKLIAEGKVTGLRVDHPDGLYDPSEYFSALQRECFLRLRLGRAEKLEKETAFNAGDSLKTEIIEQYENIISTNPLFKPFYIVGEKILVKSEVMPEEWPIFSTTGYVFLNSVNGIFVDPKNAKAFDDIYTRVMREKVNFHDILYEEKKLIMQVAMSSEVNTLGHYLSRISEKYRHTRDFTLNSLVNAIVEVAAVFPVYRTYVNSYTVSARDRQYIDLAVSKAKKRNAAVSSSIFDFLGDVLLLRFPENFDKSEKKEWLNFAMRFQQLTGPVMAKGAEDTAFYIYNRLISLNEVGGMPERFGTPIETFHGQNIERNKFWPHALITTSTHDTKRGEDVRSRIDVLSELPDEWRRRLVRWRRLNRRKKTVLNEDRVPDSNEEYLLYQTLVGTWPNFTGQDNEMHSFKGRIQEYMLKAAREAKINTSWISPNTLYEDALLIFIDRILEINTGNDFLRDFREFQQKISVLGMFNSLAQVLLKITSPGVPDFYQGTELWNLCLVDPDNRRPVDFEARINMLDDLKKRESELGPLQFSKDLARAKDGGHIKLYVLYKALNHRKLHMDLYADSEYLPLEAGREKAQHVCAFARRSGNESIISVVPRFLSGLIPSPENFDCGHIWGDVLLRVPFADKGIKYRNIFTGEEVIIQERDSARGLSLAEVFSCFPVALLERVK